MNEEIKREKKEGRIDLSNSIYVGDLPSSITESDLFRMFSTVGKVYTITIPRKDIGVEKGRRYAYVTFFDEVSVSSAISAFNFYVVDGMQIRVMPLNKESVVGNREGNVYIKHLPKETDNQTLHDTFSVFGKIISCKVEKGLDGKCTGVGYVQFQNPQIAQIAIGMINKLKVEGKDLVATQHMASSERENRKSEIDKIFTNVYVKNFPKEIEEEKLREELEKKGELTSFLAPRGPNGEMKGFAFANYRKHEDAVRAIEEMHGKPFPGQKREGPVFYIQRAKERSERGEEIIEKLGEEQKEQEGGKNVYIRNLPGKFELEAFQSHFGQYGTILSQKIETDEKNNRSYAYVYYSTKEEANEAVEKGSGSEFEGKQLDVVFFKPKRIRELEKSANQQVFSRRGQKSSVKEKRRGSPRQENASMGYEIYTLVLSLAPNYKQKIEQAGFATDDEFAKKITGMILELDSEEIRNAYSLGNVLSSYVEESLEEIIRHAEEEMSEEERSGEE